MAQDKDMQPVDVNAPVMIPRGNLSDNPGSFAGMRKALDDARKHTTKSNSGTCPEFKPGYDTVGLEGDWQSTTVK